MKFQIFVSSLLISAIQAAPSYSTVDGKLLPEQSSRYVSFEPAEASNFVLQRNAITLTGDDANIKILDSGAVEVNAVGSPWLRLDLSESSLPESVSIKIVSAQDGAVQYLNAESLREWSYTSAYFNGDKVTVSPVSSVMAELAGSEFVISVAGVEVGEHASGQEKTICHSRDMRELSHDPRTARMMPVGCTAWLIDDEFGCMLTAGHCVGSRGKENVMQVNVPMSLPDGTVQHPSPEHQYPTDKESFQNDGGGGSLGDDWFYLGTFLNSNTRLSMLDVQKKTFVLSKNMTKPVVGAPLQITGYGVTYGVDSSRSQVQQVHQDKLVNIGKGKYFALGYQVDTTGGNSGSAIENTESGVAIGIHTNGGCYYATGDMVSHNKGTPIQNANLQKALAKPKGVCARGPRSQK